MAFLHAKLMELVMEWVYTNPPPDMAEALAVYERGAAVREAAAAAAAAKMETRQYVKRQETWLRRNMSSWRLVNTQYMESYMREIFAFI